MWVVVYIRYFTCKFKLKIVFYNSKSQIVCYHKTLNLIRPLSLRFMYMIIWRTVQLAVTVGFSLIKAHNLVSKLEIVTEMCTKRSICKRKPYQTHINIH